MPSGFNITAYAEYWDETGNAYNASLTTAWSRLILTASGVAGNGARKLEPACMLRMLRVAAGDIPTSGVMPTKLYWYLSEDSGGNSILTPTYEATLYKPAANSSTGSFIEQRDVVYRAITASTRGSRNAIYLNVRLDAGTASATSLRLYWDHDE